MPTEESKRQQAEETLYTINGRNLDLAIDGLRNHDDWDGERTADIRAEIRSGPAQAPNKKEGK